MKLSEAIRKGAKLRPQTVGHYFSLNFGEPCSCALGAAYEAVTGFPGFPITFHGIAKQSVNTVTKQLEKYFPVMTKDDYNCCPLEDDWCEYSFADGDTTLNRVIAHFNDDHKMSREQIADWLEKEGY